jgi:hypothetical protein
MFTLQCHNEKQFKDGENYQRSQKNYCELL